MRFLWKSQLKQGGKTRERSEKRVHRPVPKKSSSQSPALLALLWLLLCGTFGYTLIFSPFLLIDSDLIRISGTEELSAAEIKDFVRNDIAHPWLGIFPKNNFLLFPFMALEEKLSARFPLARQVEISQIFPHGLAVTLEERKYLVLWCSGGPCFLVSENGVVTKGEQALSEENREFVRTVVDTSGQPVRLDHELLHFDLPAFIALLEPLVEEQLGLDLGSEYETPSRFANELRFKTPEGFRIYVSTELTPEKTVAALRLLFEKELPPEKRKDLEYIDARTENRLYYLNRAGTEVSATVSGGGLGEEKKEEKLPARGVTDKKKKD